MELDYQVLEVDWITAKMYGVELAKHENDLPLSKNGIESYEELDELESILDEIDHTLFGPRKEKFWEEFP